MLRRVPASTGPFRPSDGWCEFPWVLFLSLMSCTDHSPPCTGPRIGTVQGGQRSVPPEPDVVRPAVVLLDVNLVGMQFPADPADVPRERLPLTIGNRVGALMRPDPLLLGERDIEVKHDGALPAHVDAHELPEDPPDSVGRVRPAELVVSADHGHAVAERRSEE